MNDEEYDEKILELGKICLDAIEEDAGEPVGHHNIVINDVQYDEESRTITIDWDFKFKE